MNKKVSVIIPTKGRVKLLFNLINFLLKQSEKPDEILIIDNSKKNQVKKMIKKMIDFSPQGRTLGAPNPASAGGNLTLSSRTLCGAGLKKRLGMSLIYFYERNKGAAYTRNKGIKKANNDILIFIDDDCLPNRNWLKNLKKAVLKNPKAIIKGKNINGLKNNVFASVQYFNDELFFRSHYYKKNGKTYSLWLDSKNFAAKKQIFLKNNLFFKKYLIFEDLDFSLRATKIGIPIIYEPKARVKHYGRSSLFEYLIRLFYIAYDNLNLNKRNSSLIKKLFYKQQFFKFIDKKIVIAQLKKEIYKNQSIFFIIKFLLLLTKTKIALQIIYLILAINFFLKENIHKLNLLLKK